MRDFKALARQLLNESRDYLPRWFPFGKAVGREFCVGNLAGEPGDSLKINMNTGKWADFASGDSGLDLISLFAAIRGIKNGEAFTELTEEVPEPPKRKRTPKPKAEPAPLTLMAPPDDAPPPSMESFKYGAPSQSWCYKNPEGSPMFYIARYETSDGKQFSPWSYDGSKWIQRLWDAPRPLYGLNNLKPGIPVMIVEGEGTAVVAQAIVGDKYSVITWANGALGINKTEWNPIYKKSCLIWPDNDIPGIKCGLEIAKMLSPHCPKIKIIDPKGQPDKWDAADSPTWDWEMFSSWAKSHVLVYTPPALPDPVSTPQSRPLEAEIMPDPPTQEPPIDTEHSEVTTNDALNQSVSSLWQELGVPTNNAGQPFCNGESVKKIIQNLNGLKDIAYFDEFHQRIFTNWDTKGLPTSSRGPRQEWTDTFDWDFLVFLQQHVGLKRMEEGIVHKSINNYAKHNVRNEPRDWIQTLSWDGNPRISKFLSACYNAEPKDYTEAVSRNFWIGLVARIMRPGCQLDNMIVLEGSQGNFKTSSLRIIGGDWHFESKESLQRNDFFMSLQGKLIIEISELDAFNRADVTRIKHVISCPMDRYRSPYEKRTVDHLRACIFVGTTNKDEYLKDNTGGRRFWPIKCGIIELDLISKIRSQLFAEGLHAFNAGETWFEVPESAEEEQEIRRIPDEWEYIINEYLNSPKRSNMDITTIPDIANECLNIDIAKLDKATQMRVANILRLFHWVRDTSYIKGVGVSKIWTRPDSE